MGALYKLVINGQAHGQDIKNYFAYRLGVGVDPNILPFVGSGVLAEEWLAEVGPSWMNLHHTAYELQTVDVYAYNEQFQLMLTLPYSKPVHEFGGYEGQSLGPASNITFKANFEPMVITEGLIAPHRGWMSVGPLSEDIFEDGLLIDSFWTSPTESLALLAAAMGQNLESIDPPAVYFPIRLKQNQVLGVNTVVGYADVKDWAPDRRLKMRKSRQYSA